MLLAEELTLTAPDVIVILAIAIIVYVVLRLIWR